MSGTGVGEAGVREPGAGEAAKGPALAATLGHELRNPMAAALTGAMLVRDMIDDGDPRAPIVDGVIAEIERAADLLTGYLRSAAGAEPSLREVRFADVCSPVAARHPQVSLGEGLDTVVSIDPALIGRALENLVENSVRAGAGRVDISAFIRGDRLRIAVTDDGPGIDARLRERIFEPGISGCGGTGLGLSIAARTVEAHGGTLRCLPRARGSCFAIELPLQRDHCLLFP